MADNEKFASEMRDAVKALMEADPYYFDIPIITERLQNIDAKVEQLVGKAGGLCIVLVTTTFEEPMVNLPGANFKAVRFVARTFENVKSNPTGKEALHIALYTAALWSQLKPDALSSPLKLDDPAVALGNDPRFLTYDTNAVTEGGTKIEIPRLEAIAVDASNVLAVLLSNPEPRAFMFYTLDRSNPAPRNPTAVLYSGPIVARPLVAIDAIQLGADLFRSEFSGSNTWWNVDPVPPSVDTYVQLNAYAPGDPGESLPGISPDNERASFFSVVGNSGAGVWRYEKIGGAWQLNVPFSSDGPDPYAAVLTPGVSFFTPGPEVTFRARAWLPGYIPSAELRQVI